MEKIKVKIKAKVGQLTCKHEYESKKYDELEANEYYCKKCGYVLKISRVL